MPRKNSFQKLLDFLEYLKREKYWYRLERIRPPTICVCIDVPGEYWEVEFFTDGHIEFERFRSVNGVEPKGELEKQLKLLEAYENNDE